MARQTKRFEPEASRYTGEALRQVLDARGPCVSFGVVEKVFLAAARLRGQTPLALVVDTTPLHIPVIGTRLFCQYRIEFVSHGSPGLVALVGAVAAGLAAIGFVILASKVTPETWGAFAEAAKEAAQLPKTLTTLLLVGGVLWLLRGLRKGGSHA